MLSRGNSVLQLLGARLLHARRISPVSFESVEAKLKEDAYKSTHHFSLSGTGPAMFAWMLGCCHGLQKSGLITDASNFIGVSGGTLIATFLLTGQDLSLNGLAWKASLETALQCRNKEFDIETMVRRIAEKVLPDDVSGLHKIVHKRQWNVCVCPSPGGSLIKAAMKRKQIIFNEFHSKDDIIEGCLAATHIPYLTNGKATRMFQGCEVIDGGCFGQMFAPCEGMIHVSIYPPGDGSATKMMIQEPDWRKPLINLFARANNKSSSKVDIHPYLSENFSADIFNIDDLRFNILTEGEMHRRYKLGEEAFDNWYEQHYGRTCEKTF